MRSVKKRLQKLFSTHSARVGWLAIAIAAWFVHFHDAEIFSRRLIDYDDAFYIEKMFDFGFKEYFTSWLPDRSHYAFPLRDLTLYFDFYLSQWLGFQTYWLSGFAYFILGAWFAGRCFELLFPRQPLFVLGLLGVVVLHPLSVEMVQWASMRKHLLAALFVTYGSFHVFRLYLDEQRILRLQDLLRVLIVTLLSLLCWPTAIIWPLAVLWLLRKKLVRQKAPVFALVVAALVLAAIAFRLISGNNSHYALNQTTLFTENGILTALQWSWRALGRATFNLLIPIRETIYYDIDSALNRIGIVLLIALLGWCTWLTSRIARQTQEDKRLLRLGRELLVYAALLLVPQLYVVFTSSTFVWMDHYLYAGFPFIVAGVACFGVVTFRPLLKHARPASIVVACLIVFAGYIVGSLAQMPAWKNAVTLMEACAKTEGAPSCFINTIEKSFDAGGCLLAFPHFEEAKKVYKTRQGKGLLNYDAPFKRELPLIESLCIATAMNFDLKQKQSLLDDQERFYRQPTSFLQARVLVFLSGGHFEGAWNFARATYLDPEYVIHEPTEKIMILLSGQGEALCELSKKLNVHPECSHLLAEYRARTKVYISDTSSKVRVQTEWSKNISINSFLNAR